MNLSRRDFLGGAAAGAACLAVPGCKMFAPPQKGQLAVQLYSLAHYTGFKATLEETLVQIAKIGYKGVEFAGFYGKPVLKPEEIKKILADNGLSACGAHMWNGLFGFGNVMKGHLNEVGLKKRCEYELAYGNSLLICPGNGNFPPGVWYTTGQDGKPYKPTKEIDEFTKKLVEMYNRAAVIAKTMGCKVGIHNHEWEFYAKMTDGTTFFDYFFTNASPDVCMELDLGTAVNAGQDPCAILKKYPGRSVTIHAKENGKGKDVKKFDGVLGKPGEPGAVPVPWDDIFPVADRDGVQWWVVECERHKSKMEPIIESYEFLKSKGRC